MKILQVITSLRIGGAERLITDIVPLFRNDGLEVDVLAIDGEDTDFKRGLEEKGVKVISFGNHCNIYSLKFIFKMIRLMKDYDIIHTHLTASQYYAAIGSLFCNAQLVTTEHATSNRRRDKLLFRYLDKWMYSRYKSIISISEPCDEKLKEYIGQNFPFCIIKNGINTNNFINAKPAKLDIGNCKKITMVAGFRYEKDQPTVIKALKYLPEDYHVLLVGDGAKRPELESLVKNEELTDRVHFMGIRNDVAQILKASDVIVMSSHREGLSLSNVEGMCSGHPFVASDVEGLREVTKGYGLLFPHGDSKALSEIILKLTTDNQYANEIAMRCQERALQYDICQTIKDYEHVYETIMMKK